MIRNDGLEVLAHRFLGAPQGRNRHNLSEMLEADDCPEYVPHQFRDEFSVSCWRRFACLRVVSLR